RARSLVPPKPRLGASQTTPAALHSSQNIALYAAPAAKLLVSNQLFALSSANTVLSYLLDDVSAVGFRKIRPPANKKLPFSREPATWVLSLGRQLFVRTQDKRQQTA